MQILNHIEISKKIKRLAYEILEEYIDEKSLYLIGINNNGKFLKNVLVEEINQIGKKLQVYSHNLKLNPANPSEIQIEIDICLSKLQGENILIIDDVASTGRTLYYAASHFNSILPKSIKVAVLVDRKHKSFPIHVDFVGRSLATTLNDNILVTINSSNKWKAILE